MLFACLDLGMPKTKPRSLKSVFTTKKAHKNERKLHFAWGISERENEGGIQYDLWEERYFLFRTLVHASRKLQFGAIENAADTAF